MVERSRKKAASTAEWLNDGERRAWLAYIDASPLLDDYLDRQLRRDSGLTHANYTLLSHLSTVRDGALSMSELARRLKITRSRLTHAVARLEQSGYVSRSGHALDRRTQLVGPDRLGTGGAGPRRRGTAGGLRRPHARAGTTPDRHRRSHRPNPRTGRRNRGQPRHGAVATAIATDLGGPRALADGPAHARYQTVSARAGSSDSSRSVTALAAGSPAPRCDCDYPTPTRAL
jgi:DNA-binding transcriptional ArsR family regulator